MTRRSVWSQPEVQELAAEFVACADEVGRLQRGDDFECRLFQRVAEQGHYAGRVEPTDTRQGIYATAPSGVLLASINTRDAGRMAGMLREALKTWASLAQEQRYLPESPASDPDSSRRWERLFPADGLVLRVNSRDLPRKDETSPAVSEDWRANAWNQDFAWFRKDEARAFLPAELTVGTKHRVPRDLVARLACFHLIDNVRGQTSPYEAEDIAFAELDTEITSVEGSRVSIALAGRTETARAGRWPVQGWSDAPEEREIGYRARLLGRGTFDMESGRFVAFELVAAGLRRGGTQYNGRGDDLEPAPMGVAFTLAEDTPANRVAPAWIWAYGWK